MLGIDLSLKVKRNVIIGRTLSLGLSNIYSVYEQLLSA